MARFTLGFLAGLSAIIGSAILLWFTLPLVFSSVSNGSENWLGWFPFSIFVPALLIGGYTAARLVTIRRVTLGFVVGLAATILAGLFVHSIGNSLYLSMAILLGGVLSAIGARLAGIPLTPS